MSQTRTLYFCIFAAAVLMGLFFEPKLFKKLQTPANPNTSKIIAPIQTTDSISPSSTEPKKLVTQPANKTASPIMVVPGKALPVPSLSGLTKKIEPKITTARLDIVDSMGVSKIIFAEADGGEAMFVGQSSQVQMGVHGNGFPFVLVTDAKIRNFGLGRVDGKNATPILVFRENDVVKLLFGLSMTDQATPPFLALWDNQGRQTNYLGKYCNSPSRVCTQ